MKLIRSLRPAWFLSTSIALALIIPAACGGGGGGGGKAGSGAGEGGSDDGGKGGGGKGGSGSGGSAGTSSAGNGGSAPGGQAGGSSGGTAGGSSMGGTGGGNVGGMAGGTAGAPGAGGMIGNLACSVLPQEGTPDDQIPKELIMCGPYCIYRPNWPGHHTCGPAGTDLKLPLPALKTDGFCAAQYNQDGVFTIPQAKLESAAFDQSTAGGLTVPTPVANVNRVYFPGGMAKYNAAAAGKVAITLWMGGFAGDAGRFHLENVHEYLVGRGEIPYTIAVFLSTEIAGNERDKLKGILDALRAKYSKIATDPNYIVITGQSTTGGQAFDIAWLNTDLVAKAIGGSPSVVCFTCMGGQQQVPDSYQTEVNFCPPRPIRWSATVGTCDIYDTLEHRLAAGCNGDTGAGAIDASQCQADWLTANSNLQSALKTKGTPAQLFKITGGGHVHEVWGVYAMPWQLRWIFKDITCAK